MNTKVKIPTPRQREQIERVITRAKAEIDPTLDSQSLAMDLRCVPDLDFDLLLAAPKFDFAHDICGILRHMDRTNWPGKLQNHFRPRCCRPAQKEVA